MHKDKNRGSRNDANDKKSEMSLLNRKLKDLEDMCAKLKKSNETMKNDYDKHKSKLTKVSGISI
jgi:predicted RNase H-like nuclease (RuvC/YqgF family)